MGARNVLKIIVLIVVFAAAAVFYVEPAAKSMNLGLDLKGGTYVVVEAKDSPTHKVTDQDMTQLVAVIRNRVDKLGVAEPTIQRQGSRRIIVEMPAVKDADTAIRLIGQTASLKFYDQQGKLVLDGKDLKKAQAGMDATNKAIVSFELTTDGGKKFAAATAANIGKPIYIVLDKNVISAPRVNSVIADGKGQIEGMESPEKAQELAVLLNSGSLPVDIKILETRTVGPQLGRDSINSSVTAAMIGYTLVMLFMLAYYRLSGLFANIALVMYGVMVLGVMAGINATLTLPGIAGLILGVGMAVDANVIIFERFKEELNKGKSLRSSLDAGFHNAFSTIFDSNITTLIAAGVLFYFGTGPVRGFAVTLSLSVIISMLSAIVITKLLLKSFILTGWVKNKRAYTYGVHAVNEEGQSK